MKMLVFWDWLLHCAWKSKKKFTARNKYKPSWIFNDIKHGSHLRMLRKLGKLTIQKLWTLDLFLSQSRSFSTALKKRSAFCIHLFSMQAIWKSTFIHDFPVDHEWTFLYILGNLIMKPTEIGVKTSWTKSLCRRIFQNKENP